MLYADYIKERENKETVYELDAHGAAIGFATYQFVPDHDDKDRQGCYIVDVYVAPSYRKSNIASKLADDITVKAHEAGCRWLYGSVDGSLPGATQNLKVLLSYGMELMSVSGTGIYFKKSLEL